MFFFFLVCFFFGGGGVGEGLHLNRKLGQKGENPEKNHLTCKQNLACLASNPSWALSHSGEMMSNLER